MDNMKLSALNVKKIDLAMDLASKTKTDQKFDTVLNRNLKEDNSYKENVKEVREKDSVKDIADKEKNIGEKTEVKAPKGEEKKIEEQSEKLIKNIEEIAEELDVPAENVLNALMEYILTEDLSSLTELLGLGDNEEQAVQLLINPELMDSLSDLQTLSKDLKSLLTVLQEKPQLLDQFTGEQDSFRDLMDRLEALTSQSLEEVSTVKGSEESASKDFSGEMSNKNGQELAKGDKNQDVNQNQVANHFVSKLNTIEAMQAKITASENRTAEQVLKQEIVNQIVEQISVNKVNETTSMTVQLKPAHLGNLLFTVTADKGVMTANFIAENATVKEALEMNLFQLKETLEAQGINVEDIEVSVADNGYFDQRQQQQQQQKKNARSARIQSLMNEGNVDFNGDIQETNEVVKDVNSVIDYSA